jgi:hypothetical protein
MVMMVRPIMSEYPKCKEGIAAVRVRRGTSSGDILQDALAILVAEAVFSPHTSRSVGTMDSVDEPIAASQLSLWAFHSRVTEKSRRHAWPEGENDKRQEIAHGEGPPPCLI